MEGASPSNRDIADRLDLLGDLLEIEGAVRHRVLAYRRGAARVRSTPASVAELALRGRAVDLPDIGSTLQAKVVELAKTGEIAALERLRARVPEGLVAIARMDGIGARRARALWQELGVTGLDDLRQALAAGRVREASGFGPKSEAALAAQLEAREAAGGEPPARRVPLGVALPLAEDLVRGLAGAPGVRRAAVAGSVRRGVEEVGDLDLVVAADDPEAAGRALAESAMVERVVSRGPARVVALTHDGMRVELRTGPPGAFGNLLQHCTGSGPHNLRLREMARRMGLSVSEHGIAGPDGEVATHADEEDVYAALGLAWVPPELREDAGEIDAARAGALPRLVEESDLVGDFHVHTDWSDGRDSVERMVEAARSRGYAYVGISDHSGSLALTRGLDAERVRRQWEVIEEVDARVDDIQVLKATEVDILADGRLDFDDDLLAGFDWVTASVHSAFRQGSERLTERLVAAIESPHVDAIGHPTGRMMGRRGPYPIDLDRVLERAAATCTCLEINSQPRRMDLNDEMARAALRAGVRLVIGSDAHAAAGLALARLGVIVARRAGAGPERILNTRPWSEVAAATRRAA